MSSEQNKERQFMRMTKSQRVQHVVLFVSTFFLMMTGLMLQADNGFIELFGGYDKLVFDIRSWLHRVAGAAYSLVCLYHMVYVVVTAEGRSWFHDMLPRIKDFTDAYQNILYMIGVRGGRPKMDRFMYLEKLEYWSVYFGSSIIIATGIMMWSEFLWPKFYLDVANVFHLGEAVLATLAIIIGHMFAVHYARHVYPMNRAFIDGKISETLMKEEHELWYEREMKALQQDKTETGDGGHD